MNRGSFVAALNGGVLFCFVVEGVINLAKLLPCHVRGMASIL